MCAAEAQNVVENFLFLLALVDVCECMAVVLSRINFSSQILAELEEFRFLLGGLWWRDTDVNLWQPRRRGRCWSAARAALGLADATTSWL